MFKHYLLLAWRNIIRLKFYSIILVSGFAIGLAASIILFMYVADELSYDNFHKKKDRIFLLGVEYQDEKEKSSSGWTTPPTGPAISEFFPEIEKYTRICLWFEEVMVNNNEKQYVENKLIGADSTIFDIFDIPFVVGNPETALREPNSIVITETAAKKYFGDENPLGKTLQFDEFFNHCVVTGIVKDYPDNSHLDFEILLSLNSLQTINFDFTDSWDNHTFTTYVLLNEHANPKALEAKFPTFLKAKLEPIFLKKFNKTFEEMTQGGSSYNLFLAPLQEVHLSTLVFENKEGKKLMIYAMGIIAIIILVLIIVNFINLSTSLSLRRTKEIGIRKAAGGNRTSIIKQFLIESTIIVLGGLFLALILINFALPYFNQLAQKSLFVDYTNPVFIIGILSLLLVVALVSGAYPALFLSSFKPIHALKGNISLSSKRMQFGSFLIVLQFSLCIFMAIGTVVVYKQLKHMGSINLGFDNQVFVIKRPLGLKDNLASFKSELLGHGNIKNVSVTNTLPGRHFNGHGQHFKGDPDDVTYTIFPLLADNDILNTLDLKIVEGRGFLPEDVNKKVAILNEAAVNKLNFNNPLEKIIDRGTLGNQDVEIIGVVRDFHFQSFHHKIEPLVIYPFNENNNFDGGFILVKLDGNKTSETLGYIKSKWDQLSNNYLFEYTFLDKDFERLFEREQITAKVYTIFSIISIVIACLGLIGMASFFANKRRKEIGIRKVNGAKISQIMTLLNRSFAKWLLTAFIITCPIAYFLMDNWLANFAYKTSLNWWVFVLSGVMTAAIALISVSWQSYKAARVNPVKSLRSE